jgi:solute:Na+ symporter, SSS family
MQSSPKLRIRTSPLNDSRRAIQSCAWLAFLLLSSLRAHAVDNSQSTTSPTSTLRTPSSWIKWDVLPQLPDELGVAGAYVGVSNGALIVAGGSNFPVPIGDGGQKSYYDTIYVLEPAANSWRESGRLPQLAAEGASVGVGERMVCVGGRNADQVLDRVLGLTWNPLTKTVQIETLVPLPQPCHGLSAAAIGQTIYVVAGRNDDGPLHRFWRLDSEQRSGSDLRQKVWEDLPLYPKPARFGAALVTQSNGDQLCLYLIGGKDGQSYLNRIDRFDPHNNSSQPWQRCANLPRPAYLPAATPWGQSHIFVFGGSSGEDLDRIEELKENYQFPSDVLAYHTITDTWVQASDLPRGLAAASAVKWRGGLAIPTGEVSPGIRTSIGYLGQLQSVGRHYFRVFDYLAVIIYLVAIAVLGLMFSGKNHTTTDFFLGGRNIPWWAAGLSLLATQVSSVGAMAIPAKSYATNWIYLVGIAAWFVVVPIVTKLFIPFFRRLNVTSAYEYLEARFSPSLRIFGSVTYSLLQLGRMAIVLYLPALALSSVTGIDVVIAVIAMGVLCTMYTMAGGMQAVVWTDVLQAGVLVGGMLLCLISVAWQLEGGVSEIFSIAQSHQKFQLVHHRWDAIHASVWVVLIGNVFIRLSVLTSDQAVVQRYLTTRDERQSCKALWTDVAVSIPWALLVFFLGTALFAFYRTHPHLLSPDIETDGIVPFFVSQQLPTGLSGIVVAAIMAAAMSSMDSSMHSIATLFVTDFYSKWRPEATDLSRFRIARVATALLGVFGTISAVMLAMAEVHSLWDFFQYLMGLFVGSLAGVFMLGVFTTRANSRGAFVGALATSALLAYITQYSQVHFLLYSAVGVLSCFAIGYMASLILPGQSQTVGLTAYSILPRMDDGPHETRP